MGHVLFCGFSWRGPRNDAFRSWLGKFAALASAIVDAEAAVKTTTTSAVMEETAAMMPARIYCRVQSKYVTHWSPDVVAAYVRLAELLPITGGGIFSHELRACSPSSSGGTGVADSVFPYRQPHLMLEILGAGRTPEERDAAGSWAEKAYQDLAKTDAALEYGYTALTAPEHTALDKLYGEKAGELRKLKKELDPKGVFKHAIPRVF